MSSDVSFMAPLKTLFVRLMESTFGKFKSRLGSLSAPYFVFQSHIDLIYENSQVVTLMDFILEAYGLNIESREDVDVEILKCISEFKTFALKIKSDISDSKNYADTPNESIKTAYMSRLKSNLRECDQLFQIIKVKVNDQSTSIKSDFGTVDLHDAMRNIMLRIENIC